jgi:hypothetical protein
MQHSPDLHTRYHAEPRISANELARFMVAGDVGRKGIIRRAREVSTAVAVRYTEARSVLRAALCDLVNEKKIVHAARDAFEQKSEDSSLSTWTREDAAKSVDVMDSFMVMRNQLVGFDCVEAPQSQPYLQIGGVSVSVNCDILIHRDIKGTKAIGGGLFRLTKPEEDETDAAKAKRHDMGAYAATLVYMQVVQNLAADRTPHPDICCSIDVQCGEIHKAPKNYKTRSNNIETACEFIAAMWDKA